MRLPGRTLSSNLSTSSREVVRIEAVPCSPGDEFTLTFESAEDRWRQGVWLGVDGRLEVGGEVAAQVVLWRDATPAAVPVRVRSSTDGLLRLYNVWDSGRGRRRESQAHTSGMLCEPVPGGQRYSCSDINPDPTYEAVVFTLRRA